jgi:pyruvate dehydrogenase E2 component (dihydrolipoamide acetyltransferase)
MASEITMPKLSDTMTEGRLISWKKSVGERVERGDIIAEVETDKANMELEAFTSGTLLETRVKPGEMAPVGTVIAIVGKAGEPVQMPEKKVVSSPPETEKPQPEPVRDVKHKESLPEQKISAEEPAGDPAQAEKASPMVRRLAREQGIDLKLVRGSGPDGRILQEDLDLFLKEKRDKAEVQVADEKQTKAEVQLEEKAPETEPSAPVAQGSTLPLSRMRAAIARTVSWSWREIPHFSVTVAVRMGEAEEVRRELKESGTPLSINDLIIKAAAMALVKFPQVNNSFTADRIMVNSGINIGLAVSLEEGLVVPVIMGCEGLSLKEIAGRSRELIRRAKEGKISETEISGGTFSISNLGMYGVEEFTAVIQPPQGAILAIGAVRDEAVVENGAIAVARIMRFTLSADHRLVDGAYAAGFLQEFKRVLENPVTMLL